MATAHLISGLPCSGKTTYAKLLSLQTGAILFRLDIWLKTLYDDYSLADVEYSEHVRRVSACREMIWFSSKEFLSRGIDVILDDGFFYSEHRLQHSKLASEVSADACIHYLNTPIEIIKERLNKRNSELPDNTFFISDEVLADFIDKYEIPDSTKEGNVKDILPSDFPAEALAGLTSQLG
ncbi:MAG: ATP-binding protein [Bdellovibrionota bacterium]